MQILILADELFAGRERSLLTRLEVGLADEGIRIVYAVPEAVLEHTPGGATDLSGVISKVITYPPGTMALTRSLIVRKIQRAIALAIGEEETIDIIHVFGGNAWDLGRDLAKATGAALIIEAWRTGLASRARLLASTCEEEPLFLASDPSIERHLQTPQEPAPRAPDPVTLRTRVVNWGVLAPSSIRPTFVPNRPATLMLIGSGREAKAWEATLRGIQMAADEGVDLLVFCDSLAAKRVNLWALARSLNLLNRISLIEELEGRRDLMLHGDVLLLPEAFGEQRSIILEAMAGGMVVLAAADSNTSLLQPGRTAFIIDKPSPANWSKVLIELYREPARAATIAASAHLFIQVHRKASDHIKGVLDAYQLMAGDGSLPFSTDRR